MQTFADRANQLHFTTTYLLSNTDEDESTDQFQCSKSKPVLLTASSIEKAIKLKQHVLDYQEDTASTADHTAKTALKSGIFIGKVSYHYLTDQELEDVQYWLRSGSDMKIFLYCPQYASRFHRYLKLTIMISELFIASMNMLLLQMQKTTARNGSLKQLTF